MTVETTAMPAGRVPEEIQDNLVDAIMACHDGVLRNIPSIPAVVETSSNLGIINIGASEASILILARSSSETMMEYIQEAEGTAEHFLDQLSADLHRGFGKGRRG